MACFANMRRIAAIARFIEYPLSYIIGIPRRMADKAWLDTVQEDFLLDAICDAAATMDLPASKLQLLQDRLPARDFLKAE